MAGKNPKPAAGDSLAYQWALPDKLNIPKSRLAARLDFYDDAIISYLYEKDVISTRTISAGDLATALLNEFSLSTGLLLPDTLWYREHGGNAEYALWRAPRVWQAALQMEPFQPALRFRLPMPALIFVCVSNQAPRIYAVKRRPGVLSDMLYHAPVFNVYSNGRTCPGSNKYPKRVDEIPENFFVSFFTRGADPSHRSKKHPDDLLALWKELDGKSEYPLDDLVPMCRLKEIIQSKKD